MVILFMGSLAAISGCGVKGDPLPVVTVASP